MNMNVLSGIELKTMLLFLIIGLGSTSCKKTDPAAEIAGDYSFTTRASITVVPSHEAKDTIIYFSGSIVRGSSNYVIITYAGPSLSFPGFYVPCVIYPSINDQGIFSYTDFINTSSHPFFEGKVMDDGTIKISFGAGSLGMNWGNYITGKRR